MKLRVHRSKIAVGILPTAGGEKYLLVKLAIATETQTDHFFLPPQKRWQRGRKGNPGASSGKSRWVKYYSIWPDYILKWTGNSLA